MRFNQDKKNTLYNFDFSEFADKENKPTKDTLQEFRRKAVWLLPQLMSFFGSSLRLRKDEETGLYSPTNFIRDNIALCREEKLLYEGTPVPEEILKGMFRILVHYPRGDILNATSQKQTKEGLRYAANVPLILSAFKEFRSVHYSEWDWSDENMVYLVDEGIAQLIPFIESSEHREILKKWDKQTLLDIRDDANVKDVPFTSMYSIAVAKDLEFKRLPRLLKLMLCQVWVYHPTIRHNMGICSVEDVDSFPDPLTTSDVPELKDSPWQSNFKLDPKIKWGGKRAYKAPEPVADKYDGIPWDV